MPFSGTAGVLDPDELGTLESVFEEICQLSKIARGSAEAENLALKLMLLHQSGVNDRGQLMLAVSASPGADSEPDVSAM